MPPAGQKSEINEQWLLEQPTVSFLQGGIFTDSCLITLPTRIPYKIPIVLRNEKKSHYVVLPTNCVIVELSVPEEVIWTQSTSVTKQQTATDSYKPQTVSYFKSTTASLPVKPMAR